MPSIPPSLFGKCAGRKSLDHFTPAVVPVGRNQVTQELSRWKAAVIRISDWSAARHRGVNRHVCLLGMLNWHEAITNWRGDEQ